MGAFFALGEDLCWVSSLSSEITWSSSANERGSDANRCQLALAAGILLFDHPVAFTSRYQ